MLAVASLLVILAISMFVNRLAAVALELTGLSPEVARFQARSAFSGSGFTTAEAEMIVSHPVRRRIVMMLMLIGNIGLVSVIGSVTLSFVTMQEEAQPWVGWTMLAAGLVILLLVARSRFIDGIMCRAMAWALTRWTELEARDYAHLLHLSSGYGVLEIRVGPELATRAIEHSGLREAGIVVLGVQGSSKDYEGTPAPSRVLREGETLFVYGETRVIQNVCESSLGQTSR